MMTGDSDKLADVDDPIDLIDVHGSLEATQALDAKVLDLYGDLALYGYI